MGGTEDRSAAGVVAVSRVIGAGALDVAELVAARIGGEVFDRRIIDEVASRLRLPPDEVEALDERTASLLDRVLERLAVASADLVPPTADWTPPFPGDPTLRNPSEATARATEEVIREAASTGRAVIVGRGAAFTLRDDRSVLRVLICAPFDRRVADVARRMGLTPEQAKQRVKETDANWRSYVRYRYDTELLDPVNYDLVLNTGRLSIAAAAETILGCLAGRRPVR